MPKCSQILLIVSSPLWIPLLLVVLLLLIPIYGVFYLVHVCTVKCAGMDAYDRVLSLEVDPKFFTPRPGHGVPRRRAGFEDELLQNFKDEDRKVEIDVVPALWKHAVERFGDQRCLGYRPILGYHPKGTPFVKPTEKKAGIEEKKEMVVKIDVKQEMLPIKGHYKWMTYNQVDKLVAKFQSGLSALERPYHLRQGEIVSIFMETRPEWQIAALALFTSGVVFSTAYASLGIEALQYTFNETKTTHVITGSSLVTLLLKALQDNKCPTVKCIIYAEDSPSTAEPDKWDLLKGDDILILSFTDLYQRDFSKQAKRCIIMGCENFGTAIKGGKCNACFAKPESSDEGESVSGGREEKTNSLEEKAEEKAEESDKKFQPVQVTSKTLALIMYTSGSTGTPKGVMLSHGNIVAQIVGGVACMPAVVHGDAYLAYLPLAHIFELEMEMGLLTSGCALGYSNPRHLTNETALDEDGNPMGDLAELRPSLMTAVPLILDKFRAGILKSVGLGSKLQQTIFHQAYTMQLARMRVGQKSSVLDAVVFNKIKARFGGRIRMIVSGGAPLSADTQEFITTCLCPIFQGYGATETASGGCVVEPGDPTTNIVGPPMPTNELKLVSVPDMNYLITDRDPVTKAPTPRGEIWIGGPGVTLGYYKNEAMTAESFIVDDRGQRWFATGDIGLWTASGSMKIIDRKKDLVKLKAGEYIALGAIETILKACRYVDNMCICASGFIKRPVALVVPTDTLYKWAEANNIKGSREEICSDKTVISEVLKDFDRIGTDKKLNKWEVPARIHLCHEAWTPASGLLTEALKVKRKPIADAFKDILDKLMPPEDD